jgi:E3 ubiquitin-protein ligase TRIP12
VNCSRTCRSAPAARARPTPRAAPARATRRAVPRQKKRVRDAAPARADKSAKPERSSPRGKKGAAASSAQKSPAKPSPRKSAAAAGGTAGASGASGAAASPGDAPPEGSNVALNALLRKLGGGSFEDLFGRSTDSNKFESILKGLQTTGNDSAQLQVLSELCEVLSMGTEESLRHFSSEAFVPVLMNLLNADWNPDVMLYSCRALTHMMEALPNSQRAVVQFGCVDVLCAKLMSIEYIDLAEQALLALGKLAEGHGRSLFRSGGLMAVLSYLDFVPTGVQRAAMSTAAAMCRQAPPDCFAMVKDAVPNLTGKLAHCVSGPTLRFACPLLSKPSQLHH